MVQCLHLVDAGVCVRGRGVAYCLVVLTPTLRRPPSITVAPGSPSVDVHRNSFVNRGRNILEVDPLLGNSFINVSSPIPRPLNEVDPPFSKPWVRPCACLIN